MQEIGEPIPSSIIATSMEECYDFVKEEGFPVIIRPAYTLGGTGGGIAENMERAGDASAIKAWRTVLSDRSCWKNL